MISGSDLWHRHAAQWQRVGHPLRPTPTDVALLQQLVRAWHADNPAAATALLLGVTPEIASMRWPSGISLVSCDHARDMILRQWPGNSAQRVAACADWNALPLRPASLGLVVGDGALNMMPSAAAYPAILRGLSDALKEDGRVLLRLFVRPDCPETPAAVMRALYDGGIGNFHIFKFRLAMAVQSAFADGVSLGSVFRAWQDAQPRARDAARACGWSDAEIDTINAYRDVATRFTFPARGELRRTLAPYFVELACHTKHYEMGERCPTFVLAPA